MTVQAPDHLDNQCAAVDFGDLALHAIITGDVAANHGWGDRYAYQVQPRFPDDNRRCSALWRGYIAEFTLAADGSLTLDAYRFPFASNKPRQIVSERLTGDFWLAMKSSFEGNWVYVPFRSGVVVIDENDWVIEGDQSLEILKHPEREEHFEPRNIAIGEPAFVGIVTRVTFDEVFDDYPWVVLDRDIPPAHYWREVQIRRDDRTIAETQICGSSGGGAGPWMLRPPIEPMVQNGDHVFAVTRLPTDDEIKQQIEAAT